MARYCSRVLAFTAVILAVGIHCPNPTFAQSPNDFMQMFGGFTQGAMRQAQAWASDRESSKENPANVSLGGGDGHLAVF
jgi:hypothetical protein